MRRRKKIAVGETESEFKSEVIHVASTIGWDCYSVPDSGRATSSGFLDLFLAHHAAGRVLIRELKVGRNKTTAEQDRWIETLTRAGYDAGVWRETDWERICRELGDLA